MTIKIVAATALAAAGLALPLAPAQAATKCKGAYQYNSAAGGMISTPYCRDNYLAAVAREAGMKISNEEVRENPNRKAEACRFVGSDIRVQSICSGYMNDGRGRGF